MKTDPATGYYVGEPAEDGLYYLTGIEPHPNDRVNLDLGYLDFPSAFAIQQEGIGHTHPMCSAVQANGGFLCDCGAVEDEWKQRKGLASQ